MFSILLMLGCSDPQFDAKDGWGGHAWGSAPPSGGDCSTDKDRPEIKRCMRLAMDRAEGKRLSMVDYSYWNDQLYEITLMPDDKDKPYFLGKVMDRYGAGETVKLLDNMSRTTWNAGSVVISTHDADFSTGFVFTWEPLAMKVNPQ